jgi:hypothetical protein
MSFKTHESHDSIAQAFTPGFTEYSKNKLRAFMPFPKIH